MPKLIYSCKPTGKFQNTTRQKPVQNKQLYLSLGYKYSEQRKQELKKAVKIQPFTGITPPWVIDIRARNRFIKRINWLS